MKKSVLLTTFALCSLIAVGQKREVTRAYNLIRLEKPDVANARTAIKGALNSDETKNDAKTWYVAGFIENEASNQELQKQILENKTVDQKAYFGAIADSYNYYLKAAELDQLPNEKGKVKPKYLKDIAKTMKTNRPNLFNAGAIYFEEKNYKKAYDTWQIYVDIPQLPYMQESGISAEPDTLLNTVLYYKALAAISIPDVDLSIKDLEAFKNVGYKDNEALQLLVMQYEAKADTANMIKTYKEGIERFPEEPFFIQNLIALYINAEKLEDALVYLDQSLQQRPNDPQLWTVMGSIYEQRGNADKAIACFDKALGVNPEYADAVGNLGRVYYNQAVLLADEIGAIVDNKLYEKRRKEELIPAFQKALPYMEKAHKLQPESKDWMYALRGIYYNLTMSKELAEIEAQINSL